MDMINVRMKSPEHTTMARPTDQEIYDELVDIANRLRDLHTMHIHEGLEGSAIEASCELTTTLFQAYKRKDGVRERATPWYNAEYKSRYDYNAHDEIRELSIP